MVVPDAAFADGLRPTLDYALFRRWPQRAFELIDPMEAAASAINQPSGNSSGNVLKEDSRSEGFLDRDRSEEWIVVSPIDDFDGLERLIVIACGLDSVIDDATVGDQSSFEDRGRIYRALTRARAAIALEISTRSALHTPCLRPSLSPWCVCVCVCAGLFTRRYGRNRG